MKARTFITIPIRNDYYGRTPFKIGRLLTLTKEPDNVHDNEAIKVSVPGLDTVGYVANSSYTVCNGTVSAGRLYDKFDDCIYAAVAFVTKASVIASIIEKDEIHETADGRKMLELPEYLNLFCVEE